MYGFVGRSPSIPSVLLTSGTIFEALSRCAPMSPDPDSESNSEFDDAYIDADETAPAGNFEVFNRTEEEELSEVGRVRNDPKNARYAPY